MLFINSVPAPLLLGSPQGAGGGLVSLVPLILIIAIIYFLIIRPEQRRQRIHRTLLEKLKKGDEVVTVGGMYGRITNLRDERVTLRVAENTKIEVEKSKIARLAESRGGGKEKSD